MRSKDINKDQIYSLRQYRVWVYWTATLSFVILVVFIMLKILYSPNNISLISESFDDILFELMIITMGAFFSTALVGIIYEKFQTKIIHDDTLVRERFIDEGILKVFKSSTDSKLLEFILDEINESKSEVIAVGLGLGILSHNYNILEAIAEKVNNINNYRVKIFIGNSKNEGVKNRISEEKNAHTKIGLNYDESWVTRYPSDIKSFLTNTILEKFKTKFNIFEIDTCPMVSVIKIDDIYLFFPYGTPNIKGSQSPWIVVDGLSENSSIVKFLKNIIRFYEEDNLPS